MSARAKAGIVLCVGLLVLVGSILELVARSNQSAEITRLSRAGRWAPATAVRVWIGDSSGGSRPKCRVVQARAVADGREVTFTHLDRSSSIDCTGTAGWEPPPADSGFSEGMQVWLPTAEPGTAVSGKDLDRGVTGGDAHVGPLGILAGVGLSALGAWGIRRSS